MFKHDKVTPSWFKLAVVFAAIGTGCGGTAYAASTSTAPPDFVPLTFNQTDLASYALDLDRDGVALEGMRTPGISSARRTSGPCKTQR
jgi:hypothetical protein